jgi:hypothetical protein
MFVFLIAASIMLGKSPQSTTGTHGNHLPALLQTHPGLAEVVTSAEDFRLQVVLGTIEKGNDGHSVLVQNGFRVDAEYFYPASAVKLFAAIAALQRLQDLGNDAGDWLDLDTRLIYRPLFPEELTEESDPTNLSGGQITVRHEIRKLFLVSDNTAFNRLYELVGQDRLANSLALAGLSEGRIVHRLSEARTPQENLMTPRIDFIGPTSSFSLPERTASPLPPAAVIPGLRVGRAYLSAGSQVDQPMHFGTKNRFSLADLQRGLCMVVRPEVDCGGHGFELADSAREVLLEALSQYPGDSTNPAYDRSRYADDHVKFFLPGLQRVIAKERLRIYNKVGQAYGFTTEGARSF